MGNQPAPAYLLPTTRAAMKSYLVLFALLLPYCSAFSELAMAQHATPAPELYGVDDLGRSMPDASHVRPFRKDRYVGIFYFTWLNLNKVYDNSQILANNPEAIKTTASPPWGPYNAFHFWGEPLFGYYRSDDPWILRRHAALLSDAGVDFLVFDATNALIYENVILPLCEVFEEQRQLGEHVPQLCFIVNSNAGATADKIFETYYSKQKYAKLWFQFKGKPLLICDPQQASAEVADFFTLRKAHWPFELVDTVNAWHWEATYPQVYSYDSDPSKPEQVNVSVGQNLHQDDGRVEMMSTGKARGRSFHNGHVDQRPDAYKYGFNFQEQWSRAFELDPEVVFITGWNEWIAMQLNSKQGRPIFCDQFNLEASRDAEMMKGGYGDNYYMQMAANIRRYKGMQPKSPSPPAITINIDGPFDQWNEIAGYNDHAGDTLPRNFPGCGDTFYKVDSGRNDFKVLKVAHDNDYLYFYAQTDAEITPHTDPNWMWLLIQIADPDKANWEGFQFLVNREPTDATRTSLESCTGGWNWEAAKQVSYRVAGKQMQIAIPKTDLAITDNHFVIQFKWIDNTQSPGQMIDLYINGDTAPGGRFRYRYDAR